MLSHSYSKWFDINHLGNCELVIWETGLGGRLDATNIVTPLASVITNVQLDHQPWLGETLAKIAHDQSIREKSAELAREYREKAEQLRMRTLEAA